MPVTPSSAQIGDYLDTLLAHLPDRASGSTRGSRQRIQSRFDAIGAAGLPVLLAHLPLETRVEANWGFPFLTKFATRDQLPELRAALARDVYLAGWFHQMKWEDDARDVLLRELPDHRQVFTPAALRIAATGHDPAT